MIEELWESYKREAVTAAAGRVQIEETRKAFYAGVSALFFAVMGQMSAGDAVTQQDLDVLSGIAAELRAFSNSQGANARPTQ